MRKVDVWYLGHSGYAVAVGDTLLIFDYYLDDPIGEDRSLNTGVINPEEISRFKKIAIFSSHRHPDHFNPVILSWKEKLPQAKYFLSSDIPKRHHRDGTISLKPYETYDDGELFIRTFKSTDEGVAFLITLTDIILYHAGDLNWWHWDEESKAWNGDMAARFKHEVSLIAPYPVDIAFLTTDPRQEGAELWGASYFLEQVDVKIAFPMHFGDDYGIMDRIRLLSETQPELGKIKMISNRGDHFSLTI